MNPHPSDRAATAAFAIILLVIILMCLKTIWPYL